VPVLNNKYPTQFFPALSPWWIEVISLVLGVGAAFLGLSRGWDILRRRSSARQLIRQAVERHPAQDPNANDVANSGRLISRLVRNVDEDLMEIKPDFSEASLRRLGRYLPVLMGEIETEEDARIRLGVVGTYLGEAACRGFQWQWFFKADPALRQFSYLASVIRKAEREVDPYFWAADLLTGEKKMKEWMETLR
jgi:hypothetical protein